MKAFVIAALTILGSRCMRIDIAEEQQADMERINDAQRTPPQPRRPAQPGAPRRGPARPTGAKPKSAEDYFIEACSSGNLVLVQAYLRHDIADPTCKNHKPLMVACKMGRMDVVRLLFSSEMVKLGVHTSGRLLSTSCMHGQLEAVDFLLSSPKIDLSPQNSFLEVAACNGFDKIVSRLLLDPWTSSAQQILQSLASSIQDGHFECFKILRGASRTRLVVDQDMLEKAATQRDVRFLEDLLLESWPAISFDVKLVMQKLVFNGFSSHINLILSHPEIDTREHEGGTVSLGLLDAVKNKRAISIPEYHDDQETKLVDEGLCQDLFLCSCINGNQDAVMQLKDVGLPAIRKNGFLFAVSFSQNSILETLWPIVRADLDLGDYDRFLTRFARCQFWAGLDNVFDMTMALAFQSAWKLFDQDQAVTSTTGAALHLADRFSNIYRLFWMAKNLYTIVLGGGLFVPKELLLHTLQLAVATDVPSPQHASEGLEEEGH